jgi:hypothetical protein
MFHTIVTGLKTLRAPTEMRQKFLKRGKSADITNFGNDGGQSRGTSNRKTLRLAPLVTTNGCIAQDCIQGYIASAKGQGNSKVAKIWF